MFNDKDSGWYPIITKTLLYYSCWSRFEIEMMEIWFSSCGKLYIFSVFKYTALWFTFGCEILLNVLVLKAKRQHEYGIRTWDFESGIWHVGSCLEMNVKLFDILSNSSCILNMLKNVTCRWAMKIRNEDLVLMCSCACIAVMHEGIELGNY